MKRIVLDQGLPATAVILLRQEGWDAVHVREIEMHEASDIAILDYASRESRVVVTLDRDFPQILALMRLLKPSVILIRQQGLRAPEVAILLRSVWREHEEELERGCVIQVGVRGTRARLLPLK